MSQPEIQQSFQFFDQFDLLDAAEAATNDPSYQRRFDQALKEVYRVAPTKMPVLLKGGNGTEYEALARVLHMNSHHRATRFVQVDCPAKVAADLEAELFGANGGAGAANGKSDNQQGKLEEAHLGTLLLKHVEFLPLLAQERILGLLKEDGKFAQGPNIRLVVTSHRDLKRCVEEERFNINLYRRLSGLSIELPSCG